MIAKMLNISTALLGKAAVAKSNDVSAMQRGKDLYQLGVNYRWSSIVYDDYVAAAGDEAAKMDAYGLSADGRIHAGDAARDAPGLVDVKTGETTSFFETFNVAHHTALVFTENAGEAGPIFDTLAPYSPDVVQSVLVLPKESKDDAANSGAQKVLVDKEEHAWKGYAVKEKLVVIIVRPDGVIGAVVHGAEGIDKYFKGILLADGKAGQ